MVNRNTSKASSHATGNSRKGFASMPHEKVEEIASKGGHASATAAGHEGMVKRGRKGGQASGGSHAHPSKEAESEKKED